MNVQDLLEIEAIKQLKYRYMRAVDQKLWKQVEACFTPDATCSYGDGKYSFQGRAAIMQFLIDSMDRPSVLSSHRVHQPEIELKDAATANGVWALEDTVVDTHYNYLLMGAAFYEDRYTKLDGEWKLQHTGYKRTFELFRSRKEGPEWKLR